MRVLLIILLFSISLPAFGAINSINELKSAIEAQLQEQLNSEITIKINTPVHTLNDIKLRQIELSNDNQFIAILSESNSQEGSKQIRGVYENAIILPVPVRRIATNEQISEDMISFKKIPYSRYKEVYITAISQLQEQYAKKALQPYKPIKSSDIRNETLVDKNEKVSMLFKQHSLQITTTGLALDSGGLGDVIKVKNSESNKIVKGTVIDKGKVEFNAQ